MFRRRGIETTFSTRHGRARWCVPHVLATPSLANRHEHRQRAVPHSQQDTRSMMRKHTTGSRLPQGRRNGMYHLVSLITTERVESKREASLSPQPLSERGANIKKSRKPNLAKAK